MNKRQKAVLLGVLAAVSAPAAAQVVEANDTGVATETQERRALGGGDDTIWNVLGALGLLGLIGLRRPSDNDGYTDDPI